MEGALSRIFGEIAEYTKTMGKLHGDFLTLVSADIYHFQEMTNNLKNQMNWQGWTILGLTSLSASLAIAGAFIPKAGPAGSTASPPAAANSRLGANGIADGFSNAMKAIQEKLSNNDFLRTTCKTTSKFFDGVTPVAQVWSSGKTTEIETKRTLLERVNLQDGQAKKSTFEQAAQQAQQAATRLLDSKAKGG